MHFGKDELNFSLVDKKDSHKKERMNENVRLKNLSKNIQNVLEPDIDDEPFFNFESDIEIGEEEMANILRNLQDKERQPKELSKLKNAHNNVRI